MSWNQSLLTRERKAHPQNLKHVCSLSSALHSCDRRLSDPSLCCTYSDFSAYFPASLEQNHNKKTLPASVMRAIRLGEVSFWARWVQWNGIVVNWYFSPFFIFIYLFILSFYIQHFSLKGELPSTVYITIVTFLKAKNQNQTGKKGIWRHFCPRVCWFFVELHPFCLFLLPLRLKQIKSVSLLPVPPRSSASEHNKPFYLLDNTGTFLSNKHTPLHI